LLVCARASSRARVSCSSGCGWPPSSMAGLLPPAVRTVPSRTTPNPARASTCAAALLRRPRSCACAASASHLPGRRLALTWPLRPLRVGGAPRRVLGPRRLRSRPPLIAMTVFRLRRLTDERRFPAVGTGLYSARVIPSFLHCCRSRLASVSGSRDRPGVLSSRHRFPMLATGLLDRFLIAGHAPKVVLLLAVAVPRLSSAFSCFPSPSAHLWSSSCLAAVIAVLLRIRPLSALSGVVVHAPGTQTEATGLNANDPLVGCGASGPRGLPFSQSTPARFWVFWLACQPGTCTTSHSPHWRWGLSGSAWPSGDPQNHHFAINQPAARDTP